MARALSPNSPRDPISLFLKSLSQEEQGWLATVLRCAAKGERLPDPFTRQRATREEDDDAFIKTVEREIPVKTEVSRLAIFAEKLNKVCPSKPLAGKLGSGWTLTIDDKTAADLIKIQEALSQMQPQHRRRASSIAPLPVIAKTNFKPNGQQFDCVVDFTFATLEVRTNLIQKAQWAAFIEQHKASVVMDEAKPTSSLTIARLSQERMVEISKEVSSLCNALNGRDRARSRSSSPAR